MSHRHAKAFPVALTMLCLGLCGGSASADDTVQSIYEAAKKEGKVVYWSSNFRAPRTMTFSARA